MLDVFETKVLKTGEVLTYTSWKKEEGEPVEAYAKVLQCGIVSCVVYFRIQDIELGPGERIIKLQEVL